MTCSVPQLVILLGLSPKLELRPTPKSQPQEAKARPLKSPTVFFFLFLNVLEGSQNRWNI